MVNIFQRLWRGLMGGGGKAPAQRYQAYYVRPKRCPEVVVVRIDLFNDLSLTDDGGFFVRKVARGERCPFAAELSVTYDRNRTPQDIAVENGEQVTEEDYQAWITPTEEQA